MITERATAVRGRAPLFAIALLSATALAYEILLIRLFSIVQWHHFAYMVISLALLGYGASGTFLSLTQDRLLPRYRRVFLVHTGLFGVSLLPGYLLAQSVSFNPEHMLWDWRQLGRLVPVYLALSLPFFLAANAIALTFARFPTVIAGIYATDLFGAGIGSLLVVLLLYTLPPLETLTVLAVCGAGCLGFAAFDIAGEKHWPAVVATLLLVAICAVLGAHAELVISPYKDISQARRISGAEVVDRQSSPLGLLHILANHRIPLRYAPGMSISSPYAPPPQTALFVDGNSLGAITDPRGAPQSLAFLDQLPTALPYHLQAVKRTLVLASGSGMDVLQALHRNIGRVDAVELNPQVIELVNTQFTGSHGGLYQQPGIRVHRADARGFVNSTDERYDLVVLPPLDGSAGGGSGLYALNENYLYTVEAIDAYLNTLDSNGYLLLPQWLRLPPRNTLRLVATAIEALERRGRAAPGNQIVVIRGWQTSSLLIKNSAYTTRELAAVRAFCASRGFDLAWLPDLKSNETNRYNKLHRPEIFLAVRQLLGNESKAFIERYKFDIRPTTDDRPYFSHFFKWSTVHELIELRGKGGLALFEAGYPVLILTLVQALIFSTLFILVPLFIFRRNSGVASTGLATVIIYFGAIGLAFLFIEIAFMQKFMRFLHHPLIAVSVILTAFLVFAGTGSLWAQRRWEDRPADTGLYLAPVLIAILGSLYLVILDPLFIRLASLPLPARAAVSVVLTAPLAFFMGIPFSLALLSIGRQAPALIPYAWAVNGCASVVSAVLATLLAIHYGFSTVILLALCLYLLAAVTWSSGKNAYSSSRQRR